jgi:hypothetical protein
MTPLDFHLLADENIAPELVLALREKGDVEPPFLLVVERRQGRVLIRLRHES